MVAPTDTQFTIVGAGIARPFFYKLILNGTIWGYPLQRLILPSSNI